MTRAEFFALVDLREREIKVPEHLKTLKTATFLAIDQEIGRERRKTVGNERKTHGSQW